MPSSSHRPPGTPSAACWARRLGVLGGLGPDATADFYLRIMRLARQRCGARTIADYPPVVINSQPLPIGPMWTTPDPEALLALLAGSCQALERCGADLLVIPCNSAHAFVDTLRAAVSLPILSMVDATLDRGQERGFTRLGLLATRFTVTSGFYARGAAQRGLELLTPSEAEQPEVDAAIVAIGAGEALEPVRASLHRQGEALRERGAEALILGCTELPLALQRHTLPLLDTLQILAEASFEELLP